jgi:hypothetical protein
MCCAWLDSPAVLKYVLIEVMEWKVRSARERLEGVFAIDSCSEVGEGGFVFPGEHEKGFVADEVPWQVGGFSWLVQNSESLRRLSSPAGLARGVLVSRPEVGERRLTSHNAV